MVRGSSSVDRIVIQFVSVLLLCNDIIQTYRSFLSFLRKLICRLVTFLSIRLVQVKEFVLREYFPITGSFFSSLLVALILFFRFEIFDITAKERIHFVVRVYGHCIAVFSSICSSICCWHLFADHDIVGHHVEQIQKLHLLLLNCLG